MVHTLAAALGLSAMIAASETAFLVVKLVGAAYLMYLGGRMLFTQTAAASLQRAFTASGFGAAFKQELLINVLNPKVALFFLALIPQFISAQSQSKFAAFLVLGLCFVVTGTLWGLALAWFSALLGMRLRDHPRFSSSLNRLAGMLFVGLGIRLATAK